MARTITIPITPDATCVAGYIVKYRIQGDAGWSFTQNYYGSPIVLNNLNDNTVYEISIQRQCCDGNGNFSSEEIITINTLPLTDNIEGLGATGGSESISINWDDYSGADGYEVYISETNDINTATLIYDGATSAYNATDLNSSTLYYIWVRAYIGDSYSAYATTSATTS